MNDPRYKPAVNDLAGTDKMMYKNVVNFISFRADTIVRVTVIENSSRSFKSA